MIRVTYSRLITQSFTYVVDETFETLEEGTSSSISKVEMVRPEGLTKYIADHRNCVGTLRVEIPGFENKSDAEIAKFISDLPPFRRIDIRHKDIYLGNTGINWILNVDHPNAGAATKEAVRDFEETRNNPV